MDKERRYQLQLLQKKNPTEFIKVKVNGTLQSCIKLQIHYIIQLIENLTGKFWIKTSGNYIILKS